MLLSLDKLSLRDQSTAASEGDRQRLPVSQLKMKAGRIKDRTSDGDSEEEDEDEEDGEAELEDEDDEEEEVEKRNHRDEKEETAEAPGTLGEHNVDPSFWAWRLRPAALCELRHYLAFRLAKAAMPRRSNTAAATAASTPPSTTTVNQCKSEKRTVNMSRPIPNLLRKLTCGARGIETEPLTCVTPPSTAPSSPIASKRPKSLAHRHCLRIRGSQARSLLTGPHPTLGQVFDPERVKPTASQKTQPRPQTPSSPPEVNFSEPLLKPLVTTSPLRQNLYVHKGKATPNLPPPPSKNGSLSSETEPESDATGGSNNGEIQFRLNPKTSAALLRRPKGPPPPPPMQRKDRERKYGGVVSGMPTEVTPFSHNSHVRLLELPAHHQPLLHRYGLSQFVLVLDDPHSAGSSSSSGSPISSSSYRNPLRSVMRKPHVAKGSKKSVTFQEVTSGTVVRPHRETRYTNVSVISGR